MQGYALVRGAASGRALVLDEPLSFWGGLDPITGLIIDRRHPQRGESATGRILVMPAGRGSSSSTTVLAEAIRLRTSPGGILLAHDDIIIIVGALAAADLYGRTMPVIRLQEADLDSIPQGADVAISVDGAVDCRMR